MSIPLTPQEQEQVDIHRYQEQLLQEKLKGVFDKPKVVRSGVQKKVMNPVVEKQDVLLDVSKQARAIKVSRGF